MSNQNSTIKFFHYITCSQSAFIAKIKDRNLVNDINSYSASEYIEVLGDLGQYSDIPKKIEMYFGNHSGVICNNSDDGYFLMSNGTPLNYNNIQHSIIQGNKKFNLFVNKLFEFYYPNNVQKIDTVIQNINEEIGRIFRTRYNRDITCGDNGVLDCADTVLDEFYHEYQNNTLQQFFNKYLQVQGQQQVPQPVQQQVPQPVQQQVPQPVQQQVPQPVQQQVPQPVQQQNQPIRVIDPQLRQQIEHLQENLPRKPNSIRRKYQLKQAISDVRASGSLRNKYKVRRLRDIYNANVNANQALQQGI